MKSIKLYLIYSIMSSIVIFFIIGSYNGYKSSVKEIDKMLLTKLTIEVNYLHSLIEENNILSINNNIDNLYDKNSNQFYKIFNANKKVLIQSSENIINPIIGYRLIKINEKKIKIYTEFFEDYGVWIMVGDNYDLHLKASENIIISTLMPLLYILPFLSFYIWMVIVKGLSPINEMQLLLTRKKSTNLEPISVDNSPEELSVLEEEINRMLKRLDESIKYERQLTADIAHELRTPITSIQMHSINIKNENHNDQESVNFLLRSTNKLKNLVEQILLLNRILSDDKNNIFERGNLNAITREVVAENYNVIKNKKIKIIMSEEDKYIKCNINFIKIMIENLVQNSVRYNFENGSINIRITENKSSVIFEIDDSGIGIEPKDREKIFNRNYKVNKLAVEEANGIGLNIVKKIILIHSAKIFLTNSKLFKTGTSIKILFNK